MYSPLEVGGSRSKIIVFQRITSYFKTDNNLRYNIIMFKKITKEPLVHFLIAGFFLFVYFNIFGTKSELENTISINKQTLLNFMQFQSKAFNTKVFDEKFERLSKEEKEQMIQNYVREEALYREAVKLGLDQNDFVIKRRIVQKMEFILDNFDESTVTIENDGIAAYFQQHQQRYFHPEQYTFTHIFFKNGDEDVGLKRATDFMKITEHQNLSATESLPYGNRFLYHRNYAEKDINFLKSQFGNTFITALQNMKANENKWQGPVPSDYGFHWLKITNKSTERIAKLAGIQSIVRADYLGYLKQQHKQQQIQKLVKEYDVLSYF
ncbi:MAG: hypothetical protein ACI9XO_002560 [Paraglaciecola sp.]|jgi:hypothetical protein